MATALLLSQSQLWEYKGIDEHQCQKDGACPVEERGAMVATCMADVQLAEEIHLTGKLEPIHNAAEENRTKDNRTEIYQQCACAQELTQNQYGGEVACRTCHKQDKGGTWGESLHHQRHSNGYAARSTQIHGHGNQENEKHAGKGVVLEEGKVFRGNHRGDDTGNYQAYHQPLAYILNHVNIGIRQGILHLGEEAPMAMSLGMRMALARMLLCVRMRMALAGVLLRVRMRVATT